MKHSLLLLHSLIAAAAIAMTACGGGDDGPAESQACMPAVDHAKLIKDGTLKPRPSLRAGDLWVDPWLMRKTGTGQQGSLYTPEGPYFVAGETPGYVCKP